MAQNSGHYIPRREGEQLRKFRDMRTNVWYTFFMIWQANDRYGNLIYMTEERWRHALEKRPWLADYFDDVIDTIRFGRRRQDPLNTHKYKYYWVAPQLEPEFNHLVVVVLFRDGQNLVGQDIMNSYVVNVWAVYIYGRG